MNLTKTSVKRPLTIIMVFLVVIMFGYIGYTKMPANLMPDIEVPVVLVTTQWSGAGPEDIDEQISEKIEEKLSAVSNVKKTVSMSQESVSMVVAQFEYGTDLNEILNDVRSKVDSVQSTLPDDVTKSTVLKMDMNAQAISQLVISGGHSSEALMKYAEDTIQPKVESVGGVTEAGINGGDKSQVNITVDPAILSNYGVSIQTIQNVLSATNKTFPYGSITQGEDKIVLRGIDELNSLEDVKQVQIPVSGGKTVRLDKICDVEYGFVEKQAIYRYNGKNSLVIDIQKQQDANTVQVMKDVHKTVEKLNSENPEYKIEVVNDSSEYINDSIKSVMQNLAISAIISFLVIFLFLKSMRASLVVAIAIPTSIIGAIALLYFTGETLNMVTLGSLVIAVGMVVDNATVIIENIFQYRRDTTLDIDDCSIKGAQTVTNAIVASTLTTVAIFLPILFTDGFTKIMFGALAKTLIYALSLSLIVAVTLVPSIFAKLSKGTNAKKLVEKPSPVFDKFNDKYKNILKVALNHKKVVVLISILLFVASIFGATLIGMDFMASTDEGKLSVSISLPEGLELNASDYYVSMAENKISDIPEIKTIMTTLASSSRSGSNNANIAIELVPENERKKSTNDIEKEVVEKMSTVPDCEIKVSASSSMMGGSDGVSLELKGPNIDVLEAIAKLAEEKLNSLQGFRNVETSLSDTTKEAQFKIDKDKAQQYGINTSGIAGLLRTAINGNSVTTATIDDYKVDVNLKFKESSIDSLEDIKQIKIVSQSGQEVPVVAFADITMEDSLKSISKSDGDYTITISATVDNLDTSTASKQAMNAINELDMPRDYCISFGGATEMMNESMGGLIFAMVVAIILVYMVMVAQFESFSKPFIIMFCIPFAFVGIVIALVITRANLNVVGMLGSILLVGIVVNNGIVLIDYIEQLRKAKPNENLIEIVSIGSSTRLRPVLMTTMTTVVGMIPTALSFGSGGETMQPLAVVIIGGLSVSTVVTLILIPTIYMIFDKVEKKFHSRFNNLKDKMARKVNNLSFRNKEEVDTNNEELNYDINLKQIEEKTEEVLNNNDENK
ncbi:AcrB/AcrD/AcrF family protein [Clostridium botulinum]|uniref:efflux RND transporter permease subunit n=1 Tax=Clostridium botulinum TaxID=1491 RepID=UPI00037F9501|nr:efflux RND transporter permease subunit [Clostridium botulinum]MBN1034219.1 AcrB/AcrD/AcrF family protein [Clostridium botulinum]NFO34513.1 efflux RND transporter permease subunit [Clostridium botulinum]